MSNKYLNIFEQETHYLNEMILELIEDFKKGYYFEYYNYTPEIKELIYKSLEKNALALRFDWGIENGIPKLFEINAESCGFMTECSLIERWLEQDFNIKTFDYNFYELYTKEMNKEKDKLFLASLDYIYDVQNLNWVKSFLSIKNKIIDLNNMIDNEGYYYENEKINYLHKIYPWEWIIEEEKLDKFLKIKTTEPLWTVLLNSKVILYLLYKKYKNNSILLETYYNENVKGNFIEKQFDSMQGSLVKKSNGIKQWSDSILQRQIKPFKIENDVLVFSSWLVANQFGGLGIKADKQIISNAKHKFIPIAIEY